MSGIRIDAEARTNAARAELEQLNRKIGDVAKSARFSGSSLDKLFGKRRNSTKTEVDKTSKSFKKLETSSTKSMNKVDRSVGKSTNLMSNLRNTALAVGTAFAAIAATNAFNRVADDLTDLQNRLKLVEDSTIGVYRAQELLYKMSKNTRSELQQNVSLYVAMTKAGEKAGRSQVQIMDNLTTLQQMASLSGTSKEGMKAAFVQLEQGLSSGALRGEELNSIMEQYKVLSFALQKETKLNAGALREFAATGGITDDVIFRALKNSAVETAEAFNRTELKAEQAVSQLSKSIGLFAGELNHALGSSTRFANNLYNMSLSVDSSASSVTDSVNLAILAVSNFSRSFQTEDNAFRAAKTVIKYSDSIDDVAAAAWRYRTVLYGLNDLQKFFAPEESAKEMAKAADAVKSFQSVGTGSFTYKVDSNSLKQARLEAQSSFGYVAKETALIGFEIGSIFSKLGRKIAGVFGDSRLIITPFATTISKTLEKAFKTTEATASRALLPYLRTLESINEALSFTRVDESFQRAFVDIFQSDSLNDLRDNLGDFNNEIGYAASSSEKVSRVFNKMKYPIIDLGVSLGLVNNQFLFLRNTKFNQLLSGVKAMRSAFKRLYTDIIAPNLAVILAPMLVELKYFGKLVLDTLGDVFTESFGEKLANLLVDGLSVGFQGVTDLTASIADSLFQKEAWMSKAAAAVKATLEGVFALLKGFGTTLAERMIDGFDGTFDKLFSGALLTNMVEGLRGLGQQLQAVTDIDLSFNAMPTFELGAIAESALNMYEKMTTRIRDLTSSMINEVPQMITDFGSKVKAVFFDIYDAVVGHSYWPDMIDGVVNYTNHLGGALDKIHDFGESVKEAFKGVATQVGEGFNNAGLNVGAILDTLINADWGRVFTTLSANLAAIIATSVSLFGTSLFLKIGAAGFFANMFSDAFEIDPTEFFADVSEFIGRLAGEVGGAFITGIKTAIDFMLEAIPAAIAGLFSGLSSAVLGDMPFVAAGVGHLLELATSNAVLTGMVLGSIAYMKFIKGQKLFEGIGTLLFGEVIKSGPQKGNRPQGGGLAGGLAHFLPQSRTSGGIPKIGLSGKLAGAAFVSSFMFESVTLLEASLVAIPLLINEFLGPELFGKMFRSLSTAASGAFTSGMRETGKVLAGIYSGSALSSMLRPAVESFGAIRSKLFDTPFVPRSRGALGTFADDIVNVGKDVFTNISRYRNKFMSGDASLATLLFGDGFFTAFDLKEAFAKLGDAFKRNFAPLLGFISGFGSRLASAFGPNGVGAKVGGALVGLAASTGRLILATLRTSASAFTAGLRVLSALVTSRVGLIIGGLALVFGSMSAFADVGTVDVLGDITSEFGRLIAVTAGIAVAVAGIGLLSTAFKDFSKARNATLRGAANAAEALVLPQLQADYAVNRRTMSRDSASAIFDEGIASARGGATDAARGRAWTAGLDAVKARFVDFSTALTGFKDRALTVVNAVTPAFSFMSSAISKSFKTAMGLFKATGMAGFYGFAEIFGKLTGNAGMAAGGTLGKMTAFSDIADLLKNFGSETWTDFGNNFMETLENFGPAAKELITSVFNGIVRTIELGWSGIRRAFMAAVNFIGIGKLILGGIAIAGGAIGAILLGPEGTFVEKIEYAIDKIRTLFGMEPKGGLARFAKIMDSVNSGLAENESVRNIRFAAAGVDSGTLDAKQFSRFDKFSAEIGKTVAQMDQLRFEQGGLLTEGQLRELNKAADKYAKAISRLPQNEKSPLEFAFERATETLAYRDKSFLRAIDRYFEGDLEIDANLSGAALLAALGKRADEDVAKEDKRVENTRKLKSVSNFGLGGFVKGITDRGGESYRDATKTRLFDVWMEEFGTLTSVGADYRETVMANAGVLKYFSKQSLLTADQSSLLGSELQNFTEVTKRATIAQDALARDPSDPKRREAASSLDAAQFDAQLSLDALFAKLVNSGVNKYAADSFTEAWDKLVEDAKTATGAEIKADSILDYKSFQTLRAITDSELERQRLLIADNGVVGIFEDFEDKVSKAVAKAESDFIVEFSNKAAMFGTRISQLSKAGGLDIGTDILIGFAAAGDRFETAIAPALKLAAEAQNAVEKMLRGSASPEKITAAYNKLFDAQGNALKSISQGKGFLNTNVILKAAGMDELSLQVGSALSEGALGGVKKVALVLANAEREFERVSKVGSPAEQKEAAKILLKERKNAKSATQFVDLKAARSFVKDSGSAYEAAQEIAKLYNVEIPEGILESTARTKAWNKAQIAVKDTEFDLSTPGIGDKASASLSRTLTSEKSRLASLSEMPTLSGTLGLLAESGFKATVKGFNMLTVAAQSRLNSLAESLKQLYADRDSKNLSGDALWNNLKAEQEKLQEVRAALKDVQYTDSESFFGALNRFGVDSAKAMAKAPDAMIRGLLDASLELDVLKLKLDDAIAGRDGKLVRELLGDKAQIERETKALADTINNTLSSSLENLRSTVSLDLSLETVAQLPRAAQEFLKTAGRAFMDAQSQLEDGLLSPEDAKTLQTVKERFKDTVNVMMTARNALESIADKASTGIGTMFDAISKGADRISAELVSFANLPSKQRDSLYDQSTALDALTTISLSDNITGDIAKLINSNVGNDPADTLRQIEELAGGSFSTMLENTPMEALTGALERLTKAVWKDISARTGEPSPEGPKNGGDEQVDGAALSDLRKKGINVQDQAFTARLNSLNGDFAKVKLLADELGFTIEGLSKASPQDLKTLYKRLQEVRNAQRRYNLSLGDNDVTTQELADKTANLTVGLEDLIASMSSAAAAGKDFDSSLRNGFQSSLASVITDGEFDSFFKSLLDTFTNGIIDNFTKGFTESLFDNVFKDLFSDMGAGVFNLGDLFGSNEEDEAGGSVVSSGFFSTLKSQFSDVSSSLNESFFTPLIDSFVIVGQGIMDMLSGLVSGGGSGGGFFDALVSIGGSIAGAWAGGGAGVADMKNFEAGRSIGLATGGLVSGAGTGTSDSIPAMLSNREFVVNAKATSSNLALLMAINSGRPLSKFAAGGLVGASNGPSYNSMPSEKMQSKSSQVINLNITGDISRQTKSEIYKMLPSIAQGVNQHNREKGNR